MGKFAETNPAQFKFPVNGMGASATFTTGIFANFKLLRAFLFRDQGFFSHVFASFS